MMRWPWIRRSAPVDERRWLVVDVEASGLDPRRDRLLAIAGLAVNPAGPRPGIALGDSFEVVLRSEGATVDKANILLHGIGVGAQRSGVAPDIALRRFRQWVAGAPLIAFHAHFDQTMIGRAMRETLGAELPNPWVDLAHVAEVVRPDVPARSLDEWMASFGINCAVRHQAAADTLATAELLQHLWPAIVAQRGERGFGGLQTLARQRRWLKSGG